MERRIDHAAWGSLFARSAESGRPLQARLRQMVVAAVGEGWLMQGMPLPSSREMARNLGVARNTVLLAYQQLVDEELLEARERSGYFVKPAAMPLKVEPQRSAGASARPGDPADDPLGGWCQRFAVRPSEQRNIVKPRDWQAVPYPFIYGQSDPTLFPVNDWRECVRQALSVLEMKGWAADLVDGDDPELVEQLRARVLPRRGIWAAADEVMITLGAQQALYVLAELLIKPGMAVGIEEPGYPDARNIFALRTTDLRPLPVDGQGLVPQAVPEGCRLLFVTPSRHCPTGAKLPPDRRAALLRLAEGQDALVIEDDYESNFGLSPNALPALYGMKHGGRVIHVGSLSKILAPGLRLGYIVASREVIREARALRRLMLRHAPANNQRALALFLSFGHFDRLLRKKVEVMQERADAIRSALAQHLPGYAVSHGEGGSSVWVEGPRDLDSRALAEKAAAHGAVFEQGDVFFSAPQPPRNCFRLGFSSLPVAKIERGVEALAKAAAELG